MPSNKLYNNKLKKTISYNQLNLFETQNKRIKRSKIINKQLTVEQIAKKVTLKKQQNLSTILFNNTKAESLFPYENDTVYNAKIWLPGKPLQEERLQWPGLFIYFC